MASSARPAQPSRCAGPPGQAGGGSREALALVLEAEGELAREFFAELAGAETAGVDLDGQVELERDGGDRLTGATFTLRGPARPGRPGVSEAGVITYALAGEAL